MKTILFFSRAHLPKLYGRISNALSDTNVVHVAYSNAEATDLKGFGISADFVYLDLFKEIYDSIDLNNEIIRKVDEDIIKYSDGHFNLNSAMQSDRGFSLLSYEECLRSAISHYLVWEKILSKQHIDIIEHEPCSLFFNYVASILCKKQGGVYAYQIAINNDRYEYAYINACNGEFDFIELKKNYKKYIGNFELVDVERCKRYINNFRKDRTIFMGNLIRRTVPMYKLYIYSLLESKRKQKSRNSFDRIYSNIEYWTYQNREFNNLINNIKDYKRYNIEFEQEIPQGEHYYFYPMHLEPEAVVQYLADGIYKNQIKLIENIAAALPPNCYLYVKDHPHKYAYRKADDYLRLMNVPNVRLFSPHLPGKELIKNSLGVITINGTGGFEALLMGKQVFCFGPCMYSFVPRVNLINNIRDFRKVVYDEYTIKYEDNNDLYAYVMAVLESSHPGYVDGFVGGSMAPNVDIEENARLIAKELEQFVCII